MLRRVALVTDSAFNSTNITHATKNSYIDRTARRAIDILKYQQGGLFLSQ
jgi:hypothetical protein